MMMIMMIMMTTINSLINRVPVSQRALELLWGCSLGSDSPEPAIMVISMIL